MKQKFTQSKKANRCSSFRSYGNVSIPSEIRRKKRAPLQAKVLKPKGFQIKYIQRIGSKLIFHPIYRTSGTFGA